MKLENLPGAIVETPEGERLGYVKCAYVCKNSAKLSALLCVDEEEEEFFLPAHAVKKADGNVTAEPARAKRAAGVACPVGKAVFDEKGAFLGRCEGLDDESGLLTAGGKSYPFRETVTGDAILWKGRAQKHTEKTARAAKNATRVAKTEKNALPEPPNNESFGPLGKQVKKTVEGVAETGDTVTPATLKLARENNKLLELTANTLTE